MALTGLRGPLDPFRDSQLYRVLWVAQAVSFLGTWMQAVGAQWYLVTYSPLLVALVPAASAISTAALVLPGGVLADRVSRRTLVLAGFGLQTVFFGTLTLLDATGRLSPAGLLLLTFAAGAASAFSGPAYQAVQTESVERGQLPQAATLTVVSANIGKTVGPALAGVLIGLSGPVGVFAVNAACFLVATALLTRAQLGAGPLTGEGFGVAFAAGARHIRRDPIARRVLGWTSVVISTNAALWALLPSWVHDHLGLGSVGYGLLFALVGVGALTGAGLLPLLRHRFGRNIVFATSTGVSAAGSVVITVADVAVTCATLLVCGMAYVAIFAELNATMQLCLPTALRARGLSYFHLAVNASLGVGSALAGVVADTVSTRASLIAFALALGVGTIAFLLAPFQELPADAPGDALSA